MATNCLVTTLKSVVDNPNLDYFNKIVIYGTNYAGSGGSSLKLTSYSGKSYTARLLSGTSPFPGGSETYTFPAQTKRFSPGDYKFTVESENDITELCVYHPLGVFINKLFPRLKDKVENLIINTHSYLDSTSVNIEDIAGTNLNILRIAAEKTVGDINALIHSVYLSELTLYPNSSQSITGSLNELAEGLIANGRDYTVKPTISVSLHNSSVTYSDGTESHNLSSSKTYYIVFKQGGYELRQDSVSGTLLYDSTAE